MATPPEDTSPTEEQILEWARPGKARHSVADRAMATHLARCSALYRWLQASLEQGRRGVDGLAYTAAVEDARQTFQGLLRPDARQPRDAWPKAPRKVSA